MAVAVVLAISAGCGSGGESGSGGRTISWYVFNEPGGAYDKAVSTCNDKAKGRYRIRYVKLPTDSDQQRELIVRRLAAKDEDIDVIGMDVNWTAEFAEAGWILPWSGANERAAKQGVIPALLKAVQYKGGTWAAPFTTNTQLLWFHKDVVKGKPPKTWDEMIDQAQKIGKAKGKVVVQGRRYEGLVVWFNTLVASAGGSVLDPRGDIQLGQPAVEAARVMKRVATEAATPTIGNDKEDTGNAAFGAENLAFMVNYPFVHAGVKEDKKALKNLGWARYPSVKKGEPSHVTFGGINLGVSKFSKKRDLAFAAARCLLSDENQIAASELGGLAPTQADLYQNPKIRKAFPFADLMEATLRDGVPRPILPAYSDISLAIQDALHPPKKIEAESSIKELGDKLEKAREGKIF